MRRWVDRTTIVVLVVALAVVTYAEWPREDPAVDDHREDSLAIAQAEVEAAGRELGSSEEVWTFDTRAFNAHFEANAYRLNIAAAILGTFDDPTLDPAERALRDASDALGNASFVTGLYASDGVRVYYATWSLNLGGHVMELAADLTDAEAAAGLHRPTANLGHPTVVNGSADLAHATIDTTGDPPQLEVQVHASLPVRLNGTYLVEACSLDSGSCVASSTRTSRAATIADAERVDDETLAMALPVFDAAGAWDVRVAASWVDGSVFQDACILDPAAGWSCSDPEGDVEKRPPP